MTVTREQVSNALFALLVNSSGSYAYAMTSRKLQSFESISSSAQMPALILEEMPETHTRNTQPTPARRRLEYVAWIFVSQGEDPNLLPITTVNNIIDSIDPVSGGVLKPNDLMQNRQTLSGLVYDCYIEGRIDKVPGDVDGIGAIRIPIIVIFN